LPTKNSRGKRQSLEELVDEARLEARYQERGSDGAEVEDALNLLESSGTSLEARPRDSRARRGSAACTRATAYAPSPLHRLRVPSSAGQQITRTSKVHVARAARRAGSERGRRVAVHEEPVPPLEAQQRPDQQAVVDAAVQVLLEDALHEARLEVAALEASRVEQNLADVVHRRPRYQDCRAG
jgi:hypothetical protein